MGRRVVALVAGCAAAVAPATSARADGLIGRHFFPSTLTIDDPFVADELGFTLFHGKAPRPDSGGLRSVTDVEADYAKRLTEKLGVSLGGGLVHLDSDGRAAETGFSNVDLGLKYEIVDSAEHEALLSAAVDWQIGGTGDREVGAPSFDIVAPSVLFAKALGDLPDAVPLLKPLALTGKLALAIPTSHAAPNVVESGFVVEYSVPYLQEVVRNGGAAGPLSRIVPLVEVTFATPVDGTERGKTVGTVDPGIVWLSAGNRMQLTLEAAIPVNDRSGTGVGVRAGFHIFLNRLFPTSRAFQPLF